MSTRLVYPKFHAQTATGAALAGGKLYTYTPGITTPKATYSNADMTTANTNPVILDANGDAVIFFNGYYDLVLQNSLGVEQWTLTDVNGIDGTVTANTYNADPAVADQGATTNAGSIKSLLATIGTSKSATVVLAHSGSGNNTDYALGTNLTVTSNVTLRKEPGARITIATGVTLTINGPVDFSYDQAFALTGTGAVALGNKPSKPVWFGASTDRTNTAATTLAVQAAINSSTFLDVRDGGQYSIGTSLNGSVRGNPNSSPNAVLTIEGHPSYGITTLWWDGAAGKNILDLAGSRFVRLKNFSIKTDVSHPAGVGILASRYGATGANNSDDFYWENVHVWGYFTKAAVYELTSEGQSKTRCTFANYQAKAAAPNLAYTYARVKTNVLSVASDYQTLTAYNGNTTGWFKDGQIHHYGDGTPVLLNGTEGFGLHSSLLVSSDNASDIGAGNVTGGVAYIELTGNTHNLDIQNVNAEPLGQHFLYFSDATSIDQNIRLSNIISISESDSLAHAGIFAVDNTIINSLYVDNVLGYRVGGGTWYLMSSYSLYGAVVDTQGLAYDIRGNDYGNKITLYSNTVAPITKMSGFIQPMITTTTDALGAKANTVNTVGKFIGKQIWNTNTGRYVYATGTGATDVWNDAQGAMAHTPI